MRAVLPRDAASFAAASHYARVARLLVI